MGMNAYIFTPGLLFFLLELVPTIGEKDEAWIPTTTVDVLIRSALASSSSPTR